MLSTRHVSKCYERYVGEKDILPTLNSVTILRTRARGLEMRQIILSDSSVDLSIGRLWADPHNANSVNSSRVGVTGYAKVNGGVMLS